MSCKAWFTLETFKELNNDGRYNLNKFYLTNDLTI